MNLLALRTEVLAKGFDAVLFGSGRINQYLNDAQNLVARRCNYFIAETVSPSTTTAGVATFPLPADFARVRSVDDTGRDIELQYVGLRDIDQWPHTATGAPRYYAVDGQNIHLYPTPDSSGYSLQLRYWKMPPALVNDGDVPTLPPDWHHMLHVYATWQCYEAEDDADKGQYWQGRFERELSQFEADAKFPADDQSIQQVRGMWDPPPWPVGSAWTL